MQTRQKEYWLDQPDRFYVQSWEDGSFEEVRGKPAIIPGYPEIDMFLWRDPTVAFNWGVFCGVTGCLVSDGDGIFSPDAPVLRAAFRDFSKTAKEAISRAKNWVAAFESWDQYRTQTRVVAEQSGLSPRYVWVAYDD